MDILLLVVWSVLIHTSESVPVFLPLLKYQQASDRSNLPSSHITNRTIMAPMSSEQHYALQDVKDVKEDCRSLCSCDFPREGHYSLTIKGCSKDPVNILDPLLEIYHNVTSLSITNAKLSKLSTQLCNMTDLTILDVSNNALKTLPWVCFKNLRNITHINAPSNQIAKLENDSFYLPSLQELILNNNAISQIDNDVFTQVVRMPSITTIDLSYNHLKSVDAWPEMFSLEKNNCPTIYLNNNDISTFTNHVNWKIDCQHKKPTALVDLQNNNITHIISLFNGWKLTNDIDRLCTVIRGTPIIMHNPFICDCTDFEAYKFLHIMHQSQYWELLFCSKPANLYNQRIMSIDLDEFVCNVTKNCPQGCQCTDIPNQLNMSVSCIGTEMMNLPDVLPELRKRHYFYHLNFVNTHLTQLDYQPYLNHTKYALFSHNEISNISLDALHALQDVGVRSLYFDHNKLQYLPENVSAIDWALSGDIHLATNDWVCDCHARETRAWMVRYNKSITDRAGVLCQNPPRLKGSNLLLLSENDLICGDPPNKVLIASLTAVGVTIGICVVCFALPALLMSIKRVWLYKKFHWHPFDWDECDGEDKKFDVFVSYSNDDEIYVEQFLIPELEQRGYKVAYHRVHFIPGQPIHVCIEETIKNSKRTLVIFSHAFHQSEWCMWEFTVALELDGNEGKHRLLAIKYENVDVTTLDLTLQSYFGRYSYVEKDSPKFWDNLEYGLPVRKMGKQGIQPFDIQEQEQNENGPPVEGQQNDLHRADEDDTPLLA